MSRSGSTSSRQGAARRARPKNGSTDGIETPPNPDPAVFEAAFVIDDSDEPSRAGTPKPPVPEKDGPAKETDEKSTEKTEKPEKDQGAEKAADSKAATPATQPKSSDLPPEIKQRLRKLEKLEATYPGK